jgi:hypothetical protein
MRKLIPILFAGASILPAQAEECTLRTLQGRYEAILAGELSGFWQRCTVRVNARGFATGICLDGSGRVDTADPIQFSVTSNCFVEGWSESGVVTYSLKAERHKRGLTGRFIFYDGLDFFAGPVVAVKRGK